jgi:hypothetical protein
MNFFRQKVPSPQEIEDKEKFEELKRQIPLAIKPIDRALIRQKMLPFTQKYGWSGGKRNGKKSKRKSLKKRKKNLK